MKKHLDWKRIGWTLAIITYLIVGTLLTYYLYAQNWTETQYIYVESPTATIDKEEPIIKPSDNFIPLWYDNEWRAMEIKAVYVPLYRFWCVLGSIGITVATPIALIAIFYTLQFICWEIIIPIGRAIRDFFYHNGEDKK